MFGAILKATNSSFQKGIIFCRSIYEKKVMTLLAFIFEQPSNDQEIPQSLTADKPVASRGKATHQSQDTWKTNKAKQPALSSPSR